jgi:ribonucleoside-diphosphate reductase alpha chain
MDLSINLLEKTNSQDGEQTALGLPSGPKARSNKRSTPSHATTLKTSPVFESQTKAHTSAVQVEEYFTRGMSGDPLDAVAYVKSTAKIKDTDGRTVFAMQDVEVPAAWSQLAVDILVSKYFRKAGVPNTGHETSVRQVVRRVAHTIRTQGEAMGFFTGEGAEVFEKELSFLLVHQMGAFNSPVWFNLGLYHEYGISGSGGNYAWDPAALRVKEVNDSYSRPQCSACFIQSVDDDLMSVFQLMKNEARLFKFGSGTGTNFSKIRGDMEKLAGGGLSSGLMSFLEVLDRGAGATKSGGTTRRAAKMVCLDMDHPEIINFVTWKQREEKKVAALIAAGYSSDFNGEAYKTVAGQNSNNSVRVTDEFMRTMEKDGKWQTKKRTTGEVVDTLDAKKLWRTVAEAAWACADPGLQYDTTINEWHTCASTDRIYASNPCSEFMFLDDTACNLASINLVKFLNNDGSFDVEGFRKACRTFIIAQEILVDLSSYPTERIAERSHAFRPLGLGYANLGTLLMLKGIPYDSDEGRAWAASITAIMCGHAYAVSAEEAGVLGAFSGFAENRDAMLKVMNKHRDAAYKIDQSKVPPMLAQAARQDWDVAVQLGERYGYRNSQVTVLAPTGTIGLLMDCDTTGVEPDFALVKFKKLAGGGYFKIVNNSVPQALKNLGYGENQIKEIIDYLLGVMHLSGTPHVNREVLLSRGMTEAEITKIEKTLPGTFELSSAFSAFSMGEAMLKRLGVPEGESKKSTFSFLRWIGLSETQIAEANERICGTMTVEGAPHLKPEHLAVFDCANKCGVKGKRFIAPMGHVKMMGAAQPFLSGAISKTVNVPHETTVEEIEDIYYQGWKMGLKAVALYRDGCKLSQPLSTKSETKSEPAPEATTVSASPSSSPNASGASTLTRPTRAKLPSKRMGFTQEAEVAGHKVYIRTGEYQDGALGEVFIDMHKEGAAYRSMMNCFAIAVSLGLQYGVPLKEFVDKFTFTRFEPSGVVSGHPNVKLATSVVDYIFRVLGMEYLGRTDFVQVKPVADLTAEKGAYPRSAVMSPSVSVSGAVAAMIAESTLESVASDAAASHLASLMGDAPPCDSCGHTTVRNGACYKCLNCGNSMGCS